MAPEVKQEDSAANEAVASVVLASSVPRGDKESKSLFVRSVPFDATNEEFSDFFSQFAPLKHAVIVTDHEGNSKGFGFVSFPLVEDAAKALEESRTKKFKGRFLRVEFAKRRERDRKTDSDVKVESNKIIVEEVEKRRPRLIIRNLPWSVRDPEQLKKIFAKYGNVVDAVIPRGPGGKMRGFAFVTMRRQDQALKAIEESIGLKIAGREVAVDFAVEKSKWMKIQEVKEVEAGLEKKEEEEEEEGNGAVKSEEVRVKIEDEDEEEAKGKDEGDDEEEEEDDDDDEDEDEDDDEEDDEEDENEDDDENEDSTAETEQTELSSHTSPRKKSTAPAGFSVFLRNIPYDSTPESLKEHFETHFGPVKYALPVIDKDSGLAKGTAFVCFRHEKDQQRCLENAPATGSTSLLVSDDVAREYVYEGRILSVSPVVDRARAETLSERNAALRKESLGISDGKKDRRNLFLLNEGRITPGSKLAALLSPADLEVRQQSYKLRTKQLNENPSLHLSLTRLAIRNMPRSLNAKALKALARKAVVEFAREVRENLRQPLSKEELMRSLKHKNYMLGIFASLEEDAKQEKDNKKKKNTGVVKQAKIELEVKGGSGTAARSKGYGFLELRDHKTALMCLRWLNCHEVTLDEVKAGFSPEELAAAPPGYFDNFKKRRLIVEFAIEHANVVKRRREKQLAMVKRAQKEKLQAEQAEQAEQAKAAAAAEKELASKSGLSDDVKKLIGMKRKRKNKARK